MVVLTVVSITLFCIFVFIFCCCCQETNLNSLKGIAHKSAKKYVPDAVSEEIEGKKGGVNENDSNSFSVSLTSGSRDLYGMCYSFLIHDSTNRSPNFFNLKFQVQSTKSRRKISSAQSIQYRAMCKKTTMFI